SNLDKMFFPATRRTKGDLMRYYAAMAPYILPAIADRALVMRRFPNGVRGQAFYQQKAPADPPPSVRVELVTDEGIMPQTRDIGSERASCHRAAARGRPERRRAHDRRARSDERRRPASEDRYDRARGAVAARCRGIRRFSPEHSRQDRRGCLFGASRTQRQRL